MPQTPTPIALKVQISMTMSENSWAFYNLRTTSVSWLLLSSWCIWCPFGDLAKPMKDAIVLSLTRTNNKWNLIAREIDVKMSVALLIKLIGKGIFRSTAKYTYKLCTIVLHGPIHWVIFTNEKPPFFPSLSL